MTTTASDAQSVLLPDLGEDIEEADVLQIYVKVGDSVAIEQPLMEIETEKATLELPSPVAGVVTAIHVNAGDTIVPGDLVLSIDQSASAPEAAPAPPTAVPEPEPAPVPAAIEAPTAPVPQPIVDIEPEPATIQQIPSPAPPPLLEGDPETRPVFASPSVRRFAREIGVEIRTVRGSGPGGRIDLDDVKRHAREIAPRAVSSTLPNTSTSS